jgi:hypothetical protein
VRDLTHKATFRASLPSPNSGPSFTSAKQMVWGF